MAHDARLCFVALPRCSAPVHLERLLATPRPEATAWLFDPEGHPAAGRLYCAACGDAVLREYQTELQEAWTLRELHTYSEDRCAQLYCHDCVAADHGGVALCELHSRASEMAALLREAVKAFLDEGTGTMPVWMVRSLAVVPPAVPR